MNALTLDYAARRLLLAPQPEPEPVRGQVRWRVVECGLCGTDRDLARFLVGRPPEGRDRMVLGHEALGVVEWSEEPGLRPGDWVVPAVRRSCAGPCRSCAGGRRDLCLSGSQAGGYRERGIFGLDGYATSLAVDVPEDLFVLPAALAEVGVLVEPLSVVEKAWEVAARHCAGEIRRVLILGAGAIGMLAAYAALARGWETTVLSLEPPASPRVRLLTAAGARYTSRLDGLAVDAVLEACGDAPLAAAAIGALAPLGTLVVLGAKRETVEMPFLDLIGGNRSVAGSVNAGACHFAAAVEDLARFPRPWLTPLLVRRPLAEGPECVFQPPPDAVKTVLRVN